MNFIASLQDVPADQNELSVKAFKSYRITHIHTEYIQTDGRHGKHYYATSWVAKTEAH